MASSKVDLPVSLSPAKIVTVPLSSTSCAYCTADTLNGNGTVLTASMENDFIKGKAVIFYPHFFEFTMKAGMFTGFVNNTIEYDTRDKKGKFQKDSYRYKKFGSGNKIRY